LAVVQGDHEDGIRIGVPDAGEQANSGRRSRPFGGLVEEQYVGVPQHALRNARAPALTARESRAAGCSTGHRPSPPPYHERADALAAIDALQPLLNASAHRQHADLKAVTIQGVAFGAVAGFAVHGIDFVGGPSRSGAHCQRDRSSNVVVWLISNLS
jgi:hypothetical protein